MMMRRWQSWIVILLLGSLWTTVTQARLKIEITKGVEAAIPIAIVPFGHEAMAAPVDIAQIIQDDLKMSGYFSPLARRALPSGVAYDAVPAHTWQSIGVENVLLGELIETQPGQYRVNVALKNVFSQQTTATAVDAGEWASNKKDAALLFSESFNEISAARLRQLAHHISDQVFQALTGIRGAFSTRIAYVLVQHTQPSPTYRLEIADIDGHDAQTLMTSKEPIMSPAWSPDGQRLAFVSFEGFRSKVFIADVRSGRRQLISSSPGINGAPAWSPDGKQLALVLSKEQSPNLYVVELETGTMMQLTRGFNINTEPSWSPDGHHLLFTSNRGGKPQIYEMDLTRRQTKRLTYEGNYNARGSYTPDGQSIVMIHRNEDGLFRIAKQSLKNGAVTYLTYAKQDESPSVSPNGAMVLYGTQVNDRGVLGVVSMDGRGQLRLPARDGSVQEPAWSPFLS